MKVIYKCKFKRWRMWHFLKASFTTSEPSLFPGAAGTNLLQARWEFCYIPLSSVAATVWKDLGQNQRQSTFAGKALFFFFQNALVKMRQNMQLKEAPSVSSAGHTDLGKVCLVKALQLWATPKEGDADTQVLFPAHPVTSDPLSFFPLGRNEAAVEQPLTRCCSCLWYCIVTELH